MELLNTQSGQILVGIFLIINIWTFLVIAYDKRKSTTGNHSERTPEVFIFFIATAFGSIGVYLSMILFRHKTRKWYFQIGIPLLIIQNLATVYLLWQMASTV